MLYTVNWRFRHHGRIRVPCPSRPRLSPSYPVLPLRTYSNIPCEQIINGSIFIPWPELLVFIYISAAEPVERLDGDVTVSELPHHQFVMSMTIKDWQVRSSHFLASVFGIIKKTHLFTIMLSAKFLSCSPQELFIWLVVAAINVLES